jgi:histone H3/H4
VAKAKKAKASKMETVIVQSKMKDYLRAKGVNVSSDVLEALNAVVHHMMDAAVHRTKENGRKTVRGYDF